MKYSVVLPAYNEEKHIKANLELLSSIPQISEIVVVDDGSTDKTSEIANEFAKVKLHKNESNQGKTQSVLTGVNKAINPHVILYDADLQEMQKQYVLEMLSGYENGADMVIMNKNGAPWIFRELIKSLPAQSGTRVLHKRHFKEIFDEPDAKKRSWDLEPVLNNYFLANSLKINFSEAPGVHDPRKFKKYSFLSGLYQDISSAYAIIMIFGVMGIPKNFQIMSRIAREYRTSRR